jgi:predicted ATP-dependent endonuclease of OLD family
MGDGWQSLVRLAALDTLRDYAQLRGSSVMLLYEEPETYLHPHLRRKLRDVLSDLSGLGWTVVCSTHAPEFVSFCDEQTIVRLWRRHGEIQKGVLDTGTISEGPKFQERLDERGNHEMLFANKVVFCEGKGDCFAVRLYLDKTDMDLDGLSITLLDLGGVHNMPHYAEMANSIGIPWCGLTDEDKDAAGVVKPKTAQVRKELDALKGPEDLVTFWPGSLEVCLGVDGGKADPQSQHLHLEPPTLDEIKAAFPDFAKACESIRTWILSS